MLHYLHYYFQSLKMKKTAVTEIGKAVKSIGGEILCLDYSIKYFGNIILIFIKDNNEYKYIVDRGEIYFNKKMICNDSYFCEEGKSPYQKLIEIIISTVN